MKKLNLETNCKEHEIIKTYLEEHASKLFLLYRVVIFELLDIQKSTYEKKLVEKVSEINSLDEVKTFLKKLQNNNP